MPCGLSNFHNLIIINDNLIIINWPMEIIIISMYKNGLDLAGLGFSNPIQISPYKILWTLSDLTYIDLGSIRAIEHPLLRYKEGNGEKK